MLILRRILLLLSALMIVGCLEMLFLDAAIRERDFQDNIRAARCERMTDYERRNMKGYCHD